MTNFNNMDEITDLKYQILASIDSKSCTLEELLKRDFLENLSRYGIERLTFQLLCDDLIHENKKGKLFSNKKKAKKILFKQGFYD